MPPPLLPPVVVAPPERVGKYRVLGRMGAGAFGVVYRCHDPDLDRVVSVKVLTAAEHAGPEAVGRFQREARAAARLSHPHVVPVFDAGVDAGRPFLVMECVDGPSLDALVGTPRLTVEATLRVVFHLAQALQAAHALGIIHRDVKPANVLIDPAGRPKLTDFGLARSASDGPGLSGTGDLIGTPRYMSPEQALLPTAEVDHRTDIYSLGAVMYEMLTGVPAVDGPTPLAALRQVTDGSPKPVREVNPAVPVEVADICARMMAKDREERFPTGGAVAEALQQYIVRAVFGAPEVELLAGLPAVPPPPAGRRWELWAVAAAVLVAAGVAAALYAARPPAQPTVVVERVDPARAAGEADAELARLPGVADPARHRETLLGVLDELTAAAKQHPDDPAVRAARGRALRRAGEYNAAVADFDRAGDGGVALDRALARHTWEVVYLGWVGELAVRPLPSATLREEWARLAKTADARTRRLARLALAVADADLNRMANEVSDTPPADADTAMVEADALTRLAEAAHAEVGTAEEERKPGVRKKRDGFDSRASQAVRRGLEADPHHLGLLFLKAAAWHRRVRWESDDGDDYGQLERRHRPGFEAAYQRFRSAPPRLGLEGAAGRAVLLFDYGRPEQALDQLNEAAGRGPLPPAVAALRGWLHLAAPPESDLSPAHAAAVLQQLAPTFDPPPDEFGPFAARAVAHAALGQWEDARRDLLDGRKAYRGAWPPPGTCAGVAAAAAGPPVKFLDALVELLWAFAVPADTRLSLGDEYLRRLSGPDASLRDGVPADELPGMIGWGHFRQAKFAAQKDDRAGVLRHVAAALRQKLPDLTVTQVREDGSLMAWNTDEEFQKLYAEFEKK